MWQKFAIHELFELSTSTLRVYRETRGVFIDTSVNCETNPRPILLDSSLRYNTL